PRCVELLPLLARHWPSAHVVHVIRDPRDVLASKKKAAWSRHRSSVTHVFVNRVQLSAGRRAGPLSFGPRYHEVVYEALLADPQTVLRRLTERIEVPYEEAMLHFGDAARSLVSDEELAWKRETLGPLLATNSGKWRRELTDWEAALAERVCREGVSIVTRQTQPPPRTVRAVRFTVRFLSAVLRVLEWPYRLYRWGSLVWLQRDKPAQLN
ncbi:MAG: sulfotransferase, partial [Spirochaetaceae bacterium]|nr:sulfotransferase [Spirochaetaceae bacterium]